MSGAVTFRGRSPPKTRKLAANVMATSEPASTSRASGTDRDDRVAQARISGATSRIPIASPAHQVNHAATTPLDGTAPANTRPATPTDADGIGATSTPNAVKARTSRARSSDTRKSSARPSSSAATIASRGLPMAVNSATLIGASVVAFARNAPSATPGQTRMPQSSIAATATPDGGQTSVTVTPTVASVNPILAARKYATATPTFHVATASGDVCLNAGVAADR